MKISELLIAFLLVSSISIAGFSSCSNGHPGPVFNIGNGFDQHVNVYFEGQKVGEMDSGKNKVFYPNELLSETNSDLLVELKADSGVLLFSKLYSWDELTDVLESVKGEPYWIGVSNIPTYTESWNNISTGAEDTFAIMLYQQPKYNRKWIVDYDDDVLELVETEYRPYSGFLDAGYQGDQYYVFRALEVGTTEIHCSYPTGLSDGSLIKEKTFSVDIHPPGIEFNVSSSEAIDIAFSKVPPGYHSQAELSIYFDETLGEHGIWMVYLGHLDITKDELIEFGWQQDEVITFGSPLPHTNKYGGVLLYIDVITGEILRQNALWLWLGPRTPPPES